MGSVYRRGDIRTKQLILGFLVCLILAFGITLIGPAYYQHLPLVNAVLNTLSTVLLVFAFFAIKLRRERAHVYAMLGAFAVSIVFLASYLVYHRQLHIETGLRGKPFGGEGIIRWVYYGILISHVILAVAVPFLAGISIWLGLKNRRPGHRKIAVIAFPVWLYVSITGVVIYIMLYHLYPGPKSEDLSPATASVESIDASFHFAPPA